MANGSGIELRDKLRVHLKAMKELFEEHKRISGSFDGDPVPGAGVLEIGIHTEIHRYISTKVEHELESWLGDHKLDKRIMSAWGGMERLFMAHLLVENERLRDAEENRRLEEGLRKP